MATTEDEFWSWFVANQDALLALETGEEAIGEELVHALHRVAENLWFEIGPPDPNGQRDFVISADGDTELFPAVIRLVGAQPPLPRWNVIAFRPRRPGAFVLTAGDTELDSDDVRFRAWRDEGAVAMALYLPGLNSAERDEVIECGFLLLDPVLGEYDLATKVGPIEWLPIELAPADARPVSELAEAFDGMVERN